MTIFPQKVEEFEAKSVCRDLETEQIAEGYTKLSVYLMPLLKRFANEGNF